MLPSDNKILEKGNPNHATQLKIVEDYVWMLNILIIGRKSVVVINTIATAKNLHDRKLGNPYEVWKWTKAKFAPDGDISKMKMEGKLFALNIDTN